MNSIWHIALVLVVGMAIWLAIAVAFGLLLGGAAHLADEIELGGDSDEDAAPGDFVPPPINVGKSISEDGT